MAEGTYEHACMRAELLGLDKPNMDEFKNQPQPQIANDDNVEAAQFEDISLQNDDLQHASGGLSELNSILSGTQKRLNKLKGVCGSLTDILRNKLSGSKDNMSYSSGPNYIIPDAAGTSNQASSSINSALDDLDTMKETQNRSIGKDINQQLTSQVDKLDSLLNKAESAQYSMEQQNKQMKKFLK